MSDFEKEKVETVAAVSEQYEKWPYPNVPLFARVHREQLWQINYEWLASRSGQKEISNRPKIWIAGCGTFQPYVFSRANPSANILATDLSEASLKVSRRRCRFHGAKNVNFRQLDLSQIEKYPDEKFDLIECYGVLMCLPNPGTVLKALASRLKPNGVLRLMVYPHYGRQRIFQVQRLAKLLGFDHRGKDHPARLRTILAKLPPDHPLRYTFFSYHDSKNLQGIVDGFLHASDRGFSGIEISQLAESAGLDLGYAVHRPWGQPQEMAEKLGLGNQDPALWLHYLDLWQSLRTNFILCLVPKERPKSSAEINRPHPLFNPRTKDLRHRMRLLRLAVTGTKLQTHTHESSLNLAPQQVRNLLSGRTDSKIDVFPSTRHEAIGSFFHGTDSDLIPSASFVPRVGQGMPNPLYAHLFDAFIFDRVAKGRLARPLPTLEEQIRRWRPYARPLEDKSHRFGLTPFGTYLCHPDSVEASLQNFASAPPVTFSEVSLPHEQDCLRQVAQFLSKAQLRKQEWTMAQYRELWVLLFSYHRLFLDFE